MQSNKVSCRCHAGGCRLSNSKFRLVSRRVFHEHQLLDTKGRSPPNEQDDGHRMSGLAQRLDHLSTHDFGFSSLTYKPQTGVMENESISNLLDTSSPGNQAILGYDRWHQETVSALSASSVLPTPSNEAIRVLLLRTLEVHAIILNKVLMGREAVIQSSAVNDLHRLPIETGISLMIRCYNYPSPLQFIQRGSDVTSQLELNPENSESMATISQLAWVDATMDHLRQMSCHDTFDKRISELILGLEEHRINILAHVQAQRLAESNTSVVPIRRKYYEPLLVFSPFLVAIALLLLSLQYRYHLSRASILEIASDLQAISNSQPSMRKNVTPLPRDPRSYLPIINFLSDDDRLVVCSKCGSCYPLDGESVPTRCTFRSSRFSLCSERLVTAKRLGPLRPLLVFHRRKLDNWLAAFLSWKDVIHMIEAAARQRTSSVMTDFWDGTCVRQITESSLAPLSVQLGDISLFFALAVDWFNPYHNKIAGKSASSGVMFMSCLNLPPSCRFKPENIYLVGILPGRKQATRINDLLTPLVRDLQRYWTGVHFSGLPNNDGPKLIRCILAQLVCDLPAARKVAGFPGHSSTHNCSVCLNSVGNMADFSSAEDPGLKRTHSDHIKHATLYRNTLETDGFAAAEQLRKDNPHWVRWSSLNELPYWNPIDQTVIDAMHLIHLGLCQFHWRVFWSADKIRKKALNTLTDSGGTNDVDDYHWEDVPDAPIPKRTNIGRSQPYLDENQVKKMRDSWLYSPDSVMQRLPISHLLCLLKENEGVVPVLYESKEELAELVLASRKKFELPKSRRMVGKGKVRRETPAGMKSKSEEMLNDKSRLAVPSAMHHEGDKHVSQVSFVHREDLDELQSDISCIVTPSWITRLRPGFGEKANGKVKAAEWQSLFAIYLPITLLRLWSQREGKLLHLKAILALTIVVNIVNSTTLSEETIQLYEKTIRYYLTLIRALSGRDLLVVNHHLALHISKFMRLHGPCRSHWAYPYERLIGRLQKLPHNFRTDTIPHAMSRRFNLRTHLSVLIHKGIRTASLEQCEQTPHKSRSNGTRIALNSHLLSYLQPLYGRIAVWARSLREIQVDSVSYRTAARDDYSCGDANIGYLDEAGVYAVGRISSILQVVIDGCRTETIFLVHQHRPESKGISSQILLDKLGHQTLGILLVREEVDIRFTVVTLDRLIGHIAVHKTTLAQVPVMMTLQLTPSFEARRRIVTRLPPLQTPLATH